MVFVKPIYDIVRDQLRGLGYNVLDPGDPTPDRRCTFFRQYRINVAYLDHYFAAALGEVTGLLEDEMRMTLQTMQKSTEDCSVQILYAHQNENLEITAFCWVK